MSRESNSISNFDTTDRSEPTTREERRRAALSVAIEVSLLVSCFVLAIYSTSAGPEGSPSVLRQRELNGPPDASRFHLPPAKHSGKTLAHFG